LGTVVPVMTYSRPRHVRVGEPGGASMTERRRRRKTDRLVWLAVGILAIYSLVLARGSYSFSQYRGPSEIFPFFHWELFSRVPEPTQETYGIRFTEMNSAPLDHPVYFEDSILPTHQSSSAHAVIQVIGGAFERGDDEAVDRYRTILESRYLEPLSGTRYELVRREYDVEQRYECDCYTTEVVLAEFSMGEQ
jgi:hypothetical protein